MKLSTDRILTTHVGSLPRPEPLFDLLEARNKGEEYDESALAARTTEAVDEMTDDHWKVVNYLREYYIEFNMAPMIRKLCKSTGFKLKEIYELFPSGPAKGACKVAGLPKPTGCV